MVPLLKNDGKEQGIKNASQAYVLNDHEKKRAGILG
jgi:hypothetical protein